MFTLSLKITRGPAAREGLLGAKSVKRNFAEISHRHKFYVLFFQEKISQTHGNPENYKNIRRKNKITTNKIYIYIHDFIFSLLVMNFGVYLQPHTTAHTNPQFFLFYLTKYRRLKTFPRKYFNPMIDSFENA